MLINCKGLRSQDMVRGGVSYPVDENGICEVPDHVGQEMVEKLPRLYTPAPSGYRIKRAEDAAEVKGRLEAANRELQRRVEHVCSERDSARDRIEQLEFHVQDARQKEADAVADLRLASEEIAALQAKLTDATGRLTAADETLVKLRAEHDSTRSALARTEAELAARKGKNR